MHQNKKQRLDVMSNVQNGTDKDGNNIVTGDVVEHKALSYNELVQRLRVTHGFAPVEQRTARIRGARTNSIIVDEV